MFPVLWPIAVFLYMNNRKDVYIKWICLFLFIGGGGSYFAIMHSVIRPYLISQGILSNLESSILFISVIAFMSMFYFLLPYVFLMSAFALVNIRATSLKVVLFIPSFIFFIMELATIEEGIPIDRLHIWAGLYIISGCILYVLSIVKNRKLGSRRNYLRLNIIFIPIMIIILFKDFLFIDHVFLSDTEIIFKKNMGWTINSFYIDLWLLALLFFYSIRNGILGIKLKFEKHRLDASMETMSFGTTIINHTIKNEVQKIEYILERAKDHALEIDETQTIQSLDKIRSVTDHLIQMTNTIKGKSEEIVLNEKEVALEEELNRVLDNLMPILDTKNIVLERDFQFHGIVICDLHHVCEVFSNLCLNAIEAIDHQTGRLTISIKQAHRYVSVEVRDNGKGINKENWTKVFEPFFTTKKRPTNYGLGLTYCYQVMKKHQGMLKIIESEKNKGTTISMMFPKKRIVYVKKSVYGRNTNASDKGLTGRGR